MSDPAKASDGFFSVPACGVTEVRNAFVERIPSLYPNLFLRVKLES